MLDAAPTNIPTPGNQEVEQEDSVAREAFNRLHQKYPGVSEFGKPELYDSADLIVEQFGIKPEFFEGKDAEARTLVLASLAERYSALPEAPTSESTAEMEFIADGALLLTKDFTDSFPELASIVGSEDEARVTDENRAAVINKYTNNELTAQLKEFLNSEVLSDLRANLGVTPENEDPFGVHALNVGTEDTIIGLGNRLEWPTDEEWDKQSDIANQKTDAKLARIETERKWKDGLIKRGEDFSLEYSMDVPMGFVYSDQTGQALSIASPIVERVLYKDDIDNRDVNYTEGDYERDLAVVLHEYTHTQGGMQMNGLIGVNLEELRAEHFSGNRLGYGDIKSFFRDITIATGFNARKYFDDHEKGGRKEDIYAEIAEKIGLAELCEILIAAPSAYIEGPQASKVIAGMNQYIGSFEGVVGRLKTKVMATTDGELGINNRIALAATALADSSIDEFDFIRGYQKREGSVHFTDQMFDQAEQIRRDRQSAA